MKSIKLNMFFNVLKSVMSVIFPLITFPYASRVLGVENMGKVQYAQSVISYFTLFASLGISAYAVREGSKIRDNREALSRFSSEMLLITTISTTIAYLTYFIFLLMGSFNGYVVLMCITSLSIGFTTFSIEWINQIEEDFSYISIRSVAFQFISFVLMFTFVKNANDYTIYSFLQVFSATGFFFLNLIYARKYITVKKSYLKLNNLKRHLKPIMVIFGSSVAISIYLNLDILILTNLKGDYQVGLYSASVKIMNVVKTLINSITVIGVARLSWYLKHDNIKEYEVLLKNCLNSELLLLIPICLGISMLGYYAIFIFSGEAFTPATLSCQILGFNSVVSVVNGLFMNQYFIPAGKEKIGCFATIAGALTNLVLDLILIPPFGLNGAAVATFLAEAIVGLVFLYYLNKAINVKYLFDQLPKIIVAALPILLICWVMIQLFSNVWLICIMSVLVSFVVYFGLLIVLKMNLANDLLRDIIGLTKRIIKK